MSYDQAGAAGQPQGADHPESTKLLILSIVALLCCGPLSIYTLIRSQQILQEPNPGSVNLGKVSAVRIISIISLVLWVIGSIGGTASGVFGNFGS